MNKKQILWLVGVLPVLMLGCGQQKVPEEPLRPVRVMAVKAAAASAVTQFSGEVRARQETALSFRVPGKLIRRSVDVGAEIKPGMSLAQLDTRDMLLNVEAAKAQADSAKTDLSQMELNLRRAQDLFARKFVSQAEVDQKQTAMTASSKRVEQAEAQLRIAQNQMGYANLLADVAGVVTGVDAEPGQVLAAGQSVVRVARDGEREVVIDVAETHRTDITVGQAAEIELWALPGHVYKGRVREIAPAADSQTRTYRVRVQLADGDPSVQLGMSATIRLETARAVSGVVLPMTAVFGRGQEQRVWLLDVKTGLVRSTPVQVMDMGSETIQVNGLKDGDVVVTAGVHLLREGQKVKPLAMGTSKVGV